ncbi:hypothetical protein SH449x_005080 [Pirellulaceae bacterium SH449]
MSQSMVDKEQEQRAEYRHDEECKHHSDGHEMLVSALYQFQSCHYYQIRLLSCEIFEGILIIRGQVCSYYLKQLAQERLRLLTGMDQIMNQIDVVYGASMTVEKEEHGA